MSKEQKYYIPDLETGYMRAVSKTVWEAYKAHWEACKPKIAGDYLPPGPYMVFGTADETSSNYQDFQKLFNDFKDE